MGKKSNQQQETPQQRAMTELATRQLADYRQRWLPVQQRLAGSIKRSGAADSFERRQAEGQASTEGAVRFGEARGGLESALTESGAGPNSSKFKLAMTGLDDDEATSRGLGFVAADQAIDDAYMQGLGALTAIGRGERAGAINGMQAVADLSGRTAANDAAMSAQRRAGNAQLVGQAAGFGLSGAMRMKPNVPSYGGTVGLDINPGGSRINNRSAFVASQP